MFELNKDPHWRRIVGKAEADIRMRDIELILRLFAVANNVKQYAKPMKDFLSAFMKEHRNLPAQQLDAYKKTFVGAVTSVVNCLGSRPFHLRQGINIPTCEAVVTAFMKNKNAPGNMKERFKALIGNDDFKSYTSDATTDTDVVKKRYKLAEQELFG